MNDQIGWPAAVAIVGVAVSFASIVWAMMWGIVRFEEVALCNGEEIDDDDAGSS